MTLSTQYTAAQLDVLAFLAHTLEENHDLFAAMDPASPEWDAFVSMATAMLDRIPGDWYIANLELRQSNWKQFV